MSPEYAQLIEKTFDLERKSQEIYSNLKTNCSSYISVEKSICLEQFPNYDGITQLSQLCDPIVWVDLNFIEKLKKIFAFNEMKKYSDDAKLILDFFEQNVGKFILH